MIRLFLLALCADVVFAGDLKVIVTNNGSEVRIYHNDQSMMPPTPPGPTIGWEDISPLIQAYCAPCHTTTGTPPVLSTELAFLSRRDSVIIKMEDGSMPPVGSPQRNAFDQNPANRETILNYARSL